jgi:hypothetical protein
MVGSEAETINQRFKALAKCPFRAKFHLCGKELSIVREKGIGVVRQHATELLSKRLFPAHLPNDGKQRSIIAK